MGDETSVAWMVAEAHYWFELYGHPPTAAEWNVASMRWHQRAYDAGRSNGRPSDATVAEAERRHRDDGPWPSQNNITTVFGSWNAFVKAAGFEPVPISTGRRKVAA